MKKVGATREKKEEPNEKSRRSHMKKEGGAT